jgi:membrane protein DedA with SNARE-associated domain
VFFGRMIPIFRSLISVPAGLERMRMAAFLVYTTLGSLLWNTAFVLAGYWLGDNWTAVQDLVGVYSKAVVAVVAVAVAAFLAVRIVKARGGRHRGTPAREGAQVREGAHAREGTSAPHHLRREFDRDRIR